MGTRDDFTGRIEQIVLEESERFKDELRRASDEVRPMGSREVPLKEQVHEFELMIDSPGALELFFEQQGASVESAIIYSDKMMREMRKKYGGLPTDNTDYGP